MTNRIHCSKTHHWPAGPCFLHFGIETNSELNFRFEFRANHYSLSALWFKSQLLTRPHVLNASSAGRRPTQQELVTDGTITQTDGLTYQGGDLWFHLFRDGEHNKKVTYSFFSVCLSLSVHPKASQLPLRPFQLPFRPSQLSLRPYYLPLRPPSKSLYLPL